MPYAFHPDLRTPPNSTVLWRYMDFARFVAMIESRSLWFTRLDQLEDPLEGTHTDAELTWIRQKNKKKHANQLIRVFRQARKEVFVNCWRSGSAESLAMWDLYGKGTGIVAVKSTVGLLKKAVSSSGRAVFISKTRYFDWSDAPGIDNVLVACSRKDLSYQHESEVRAMVMGDFRNSLAHRQLGMLLPVDVETLIGEIMVGPREQRWVVHLVKQIMERYKLLHPVVVSNRLKARR
jgi:hypothetical protein